METSLAIHCPFWAYRSCPIGDLVTIGLQVVFVLIRQLRLVPCTYELPKPSLAKTAFPLDLTAIVLFMPLKWGVN